MYTAIISLLVIAFLLNPIFTLLRINRVTKRLNTHTLPDTATEQAQLAQQLSAGIYLANELATQAPVVVTNAEFNQHALVIGTTGSGKTTTLMNIVAGCCIQGLPLIYVDGKGSVKLLQQIQQICDKYQRKLKVFSLDPNAQLTNICAYNPFAFGNFTEWKNKIITLTQEADTKGQEHYSLQEQSYISLLCEILHKAKVYVDLEAIIAYIKDREELQKLANRISPEMGSRLIKMGKDSDESDLIKVLETFYYSHYGELFVTSDKDSDEIINLQQSIEDGEIVLFLLDAASYKRDTNLLGKLIINDINAAFSAFGRNNQRYNGYCVFDEFAAYATSNMASILSMQRDNGLHAIVGTQSIHAISVENTHVKRVAVELIANCNTFIIHKINDPNDIELLINTIGTKMHAEVSNTHGSQEAHTRHTTRMVEKYLIRAQDIRSLQAGFGYICRTVVTQKPVKVKFLKLD